MTLFDERGVPTPEAAAARRDAGVAQAEAGAGDDWLDQAFEFLRAYAEEHEEVFVDDLWEAGLTPPANRRALGPVLMRAARAGVIEKTGQYRPSTSSNLSVKPVWRSRVYCGGS
jgi:hypothetical protein